MRVLSAIRTKKVIAIGTAVIVGLMAMTFAQGQEAQGAPPTAILENLGGMAQGLGRLGLPGGPPVMTLLDIDGKGPKDFGGRGRIFGSKFKVALTTGQHLLSVSFNESGYNNTYSTSGPVLLSFIAEPGRTYAVECSVDNSSGRWIPFVVDRTDKAHPVIVLPPKATSANPSYEVPSTYWMLTHPSDPYATALSQFGQSKPSANGADALQPSQQAWITLETGLRDYHSANYDAAIVQFQKVIHDYPQDAQVCNAQFYLGEIAYRQQDYAGAVRAYEAVLEGFGESPKAPAAHLGKGLALLAMNKNDEGIHELRLLIMRFPNTPEASQARVKLNSLGVKISAQ